jgi:hypothetical protein
MIRWSRYWLRMALGAVDDAAARGSAVSAASIAQIVMLMISLDF